ncbi:MAG: DoxX family protein [Bacteroidia bacterium]
MSEKTRKIIYWIFTAWMSLGMISSAIVQLMRAPEEVDKITSIQFPLYILTLLAVLKIIGIVVVLIPKFPLLKEWAYAGFFFTMLGAVYAHLAVAEPIKKMLPALLLLVLTMISWYFRPASRKILLQSI